MLCCDYADRDDLVRFLDLIKPFVPLLPEISLPETKVPFNQKVMWTGVCLPLQENRYGRRRMKINT
jgi:hypothetical protein